MERNTTVEALFQDLMNNGSMENHGLCARIRL